MLNDYFNLNDRYLYGKVMRVIFPLRHWQKYGAEHGPCLSDEIGANEGSPFGRRSLGGEEEGAPEVDESAVEDLNHLDLYIPLMSLLTFALLLGFEFGAENNFHPDQIGYVVVKSLMLWLLEALVVRIGAYALGLELSYLDLLCLTGYKFVGLALSEAVFVFTGSTVLNYASTAFLGVMGGLFFFKAVRKGSV